MVQRFTGSMGSNLTSNGAPSFSNYTFQSQKINYTQMRTANRNIGVAPLSICFDCTEDGPDDLTIQPSGSYRHVDYDYRWDFGDSSAGNWNYGLSSSRNEALGPIGVHVYETPGFYIAKLQIVNDVGETYFYEQRIIVQDPEVIYSGATYYVAANGNDNNNGLTSSTPFLTVAKGFTTLFASNGPRRLLLRRGDSFTVPDALYASNKVGPFTIDAYGSGAKPLITTTWEGFNIRSSTRDVRIMNLQMTTGVAQGEQGIQLGASTLCLNLDMTKFARHFAIYDSSATGSTIANCTLVSAATYGTFVGPTGSDTSAIKNFAVLGNYYDFTSNNALLRNYVSRSVWQSNTFLRAPQSPTRFLGLEIPNICKQNVAIDNYFSNNNNWTLELGPENEDESQTLTDVLVERNLFEPLGGSARCIVAMGPNIRIRNNIFDLSQATNANGISVFNRVTNATPIVVSGVIIENNTLYSNVAAPDVSFATATTSGNTIVRNNIVYAPNVSNQANVTIATGTVTDQTNLKTNPSFVDAANGDFRLQAGSAAIDTGTSNLVRRDFYNAVRPQGSGVDIGAAEKV